MKLLAISGSLQSASSNSALLAHAAALVAAPDELVLFDGLADLPHFNPDRDRDPAPSSVQRIRDAVARADAIVIATPEYAGGMPGSLKNALDWLVGSGELYGKPAVVVNAAPSCERGWRARESVELTLTMQGARVCDSFTVAVPRGITEEDMIAGAAATVTRVVRALAPVGEQHATDIEYGPSTPDGEGEPCLTSRRSPT